MAFHDNAAEKALAMGKNASEFSVAAQKQANSTWFYLIVAGGVWYFFGWQWALIPAALGVIAILKSVSSTSIATRLEKMEQVSSASEPLQPDFVKIVQDYGAVLMEATPGVVSDVSNLPHNKQKIKDAIISSLQATNEDSLKQHLKTAYIQLADWQDGVGEKSKGLDASSLDMSQDATELAQIVHSQVSEGKELTEKMLDESKQLQRELEELDLR
jgi:hypothetical protein